MSRHAFVSYSRTDTAYVSELIAWLMSHGVPVWSDIRITYGSEWPAVVRDAVDQAAVVLVVMSPDAEASGWVDRELARAELRGIPVVPLLLAGDPFFRLGSTHYDDVRGGRLPNDELAAYVSDLCNAPDQPGEPFESGVRILDADGNTYPRDEPFAAQLTEFLRWLTTRESDPFIIVERIGAPTYFAQAYFDREANSFDVEYHDGGPEQHFRAWTDDVELVANVIAGWVDRTDGWATPLQWEPVPPS